MASNFIDNFSNPLKYRESVPFSQRWSKSKTLRSKYPEYCPCLIMIRPKDERYLLSKWKFMVDQETALFDLSRTILSFIKINPHFIIDPQKLGKVGETFQSILDMESLQIKISVAHFDSNEELTISDPLPSSLIIKYIDFDNKESFKSSIINEKTWLKKPPPKKSIRSARDDDGFVYLVIDLI